MTVLIDSWAWIEYFKGGKHSREAMKYIESDDEAAVSTINILEVYVWVAKFYSERVAAEKIGVVEKRCYVIPVEKEIAVSAARLKLKHRLGIADSVILATARHLNGKLVTGDSDFKKIEGVVFVGE
jgi:predicted nucleic acid-binding protein